MLILKNNKFKSFRAVQLIYLQLLSKSQPILILDLMAGTRIHIQILILVEINFQIMLLGILALPELQFGLIKINN